MNFSSAWRSGYALSPNRMVRRRGKFRANRSLCHCSRPFALLVSAAIGFLNPGRRPRIPPRAGRSRGPCRAAGRGCRLGGRADPSRARRQSRDRASRRRSVGPARRRQRRDAASGHLHRLGRGSLRRDLSGRRGAAGRVHRLALHDAGRRCCCWSLSGNLVQLVLAWIATSLFLHRLLLFYPDRVAAQRAARKKFVTARLGDVALIGAAVLLDAGLRHDRHRRDPEAPPARETAAAWRSRAAGLLAARGAVEVGAVSDCTAG